MDSAGLHRDASAHRSEWSDGVSIWLGGAWFVTGPHGGFVMIAIAHRLPAQIAAPRATAGRQRSSRNAFLTEELPRDRFCGAALQ